MTIRIERHALLRVISTSPPSSSTSLIPPFSHESPIPDDEEEFVIVELPEKKAETATNDFFAAPVTTAYDDDSQTVISSVLSEEEDDSSCSTRSSSSTESRVSFAEDLVTDVWTRPYTPMEDVPTLFYDSDTIAQFRHEYRLERKVLTELAVDPETLSNVDEEDLTSLLVPPSSCPSTSSGSSSSLSSALYRISRVVVVHNDKLETFFNPEEEAVNAIEPKNNNNSDEMLTTLSSLPLSESFCLGLEDPWQEGKEGQLPRGSNHQQEHHYVRQELLTSFYQHPPQCTPTNTTANQAPSHLHHQSADFFDNDSFWSGSLTWY